MIGSKYTATVVNGESFNVSIISEDQVEVDGELLSYSFVDQGNGSFSLILNGAVYPVRSFGNEITQRIGLNGNGAGRIITTEVFGTTFDVRVDDERSLLLKALSSKTGSVGGTRVVRAPMPGLISRVEVSVGEEVSSGTGLLVLEAMKMENEIRSSFPGRIESIHVSQGKAVEKGEPLVTIIEL